MSAELAAGPWLEDAETEGDRIRRDASVLRECHTKLGLPANPPMRTTMSEVH